MSTASSFVLVAAFPSLACIFARLACGGSAARQEETRVKAHRVTQSPSPAAAASGGALLCVVFSLFVKEPPRDAPAKGEAPGLWQVVCDPRQVYAGIVIAIAGVAFATIFVFHQPFALELGFSQLRAFFIAYTSAALVSRFALGPVVDRIGGYRVALASLILYGFVVALASQLGALGLATIGGLFGLAHGFFYPACNSLAVEGVSEHVRGKVMALFQAWFNAGLAAGTLGMGLLADAVGFPTRCSSRRGR